MDVAGLCSKYRQEAEEFDKPDMIELMGNVLQHQVTLTTTTLYNGVDMKDRALKYIVSELWNPLVNVKILGHQTSLMRGYLVLTVNFAIVYPIVKNCLVRVFSQSIS